MADNFDLPARSSRQRWSVVTALAGSIGLAGFVLVACGGGSGKSASATSASASSPAATAGSSTAGSSTAGSSASTSPAGPSAGNSTAIPHGNGSSSFCALARAISTQGTKNVAVFTSGNPTAIEKLEKQNLSVLTGAVSLAPSSLRPSMVILANADRALYKELQAIKFDFRKLSPAQTANLDSPALTKASDTVDSYVTNVCHISTTSATSH